MLRHIHTLTGSVKHAIDCGSHGKCTLLASFAVKGAAYCMPLLRVSEILVKPSILLSLAVHRYHIF